MDPNSLSKKKLFGSFVMPPSWAFGGHGRVPPPPNGSAIATGYTGGRGGGGAPGP